MGPIHLMCLLHPGAAAAAAVAVVYSVWVVERQKQDRVCSSKPGGANGHEQNQQAMQRQQQELTQLLKRQQEQQHKRAPIQDMHMSYPSESATPRPHRVVGSNAHDASHEHAAKQSQQGAAVCSSTDSPPEQPAPIHGQLGVIYQRPPLDYDTRIPVLRAHSGLPAFARAFAPTSVAVRHRPHPPCIPQPLQSGLAHRPQPGPPIPHPAAIVLSGTSGGGARQLSLKLLATATAVLLGAAAFPAMFSTITQRMHTQQQRQQQQQQRSVGLPDGTLSALSAGSPSSSSSSSDGANLGHAAPGDMPVHSTHRGRKQFALWMQQQLPTVLQQKRQELQRLQGLQGVVGSVQDSSRGVVKEHSAGRELSAAFGALQGCLGEEVESLQIQVGALEAAAVVNKR